MARKNSRVSKGNIRGRYRSEVRGQVPRIQAPRVSLGELVLPDGQCMFQARKRPKARFATEESAAKALAQAQAQRARSGSAHVEKRFYPCPEGGCGGFHLTSREEYDTEAWKKRRGEGL